MLYSFRLKSTPAAQAVMGQQKQEIVNGIVKDAEKLQLEKGDYAVFDVNVDGGTLKVIVQFQSRVLTVLTLDEYHKTTLPGSAQIN
jgi:hypothetical protein